MHSALFVARISGVEPNKWERFLKTAKVELHTYPNVSCLAENVWVVNFQENPDLFPILSLPPTLLESFMEFFHLNMRPNGFRAGLIPIPFGAEVKRHKFILF